MRIESSTITMAASRNYTAEAMEQQTTITRRYDGDVLQNASDSVAVSKVSQFEVEGGTAVFTSSKDGIERTDKNQIDYAHSSTKPLTDSAQGAQPQAVSVPSAGSSIAAWDFEPDVLLKRLLELLDRISGKKVTWRGHELPSSKQSTSVSNSYRMSAVSASMRYQETIALLNGEQSDVGDANAAVIRQAQSLNGSVNGHWTRQTVTSGFVAGEENTAFRSSGTVVTSDGRTINFGITLEMSRSFEAAYVSSTKEEVFTDPLIINMDTDAAALADVSFYFDLNCDGVEEEMSGLDAASGFLALDKNGDGKINNGSELFGAKTGDGFSELAAYDQDGNGWIDEGDEIFSRLKVWTKCGTEDAKLLSLSEADVGAIFLGSQNTQYSLIDSYGDTGAMIRKTGVYLKESGGAGTVQHVDFKA